MQPINKFNRMKKKKLEINENILMSNEELTQIRGGERTRTRVKEGPYTIKKKVIS